MSNPQPSSPQNYEPLATIATMMSSEDTSLAKLTNTTMFQPHNLPMGGA